MSLSKEKNADLHLHSIYSDGLLAPDELVRQAAAAGLAIISLTDHDCVDGIEEARAAAASEGLKLISGVELSATYKGHDVHVLGYGIDEADAGLRSFLKMFQEARGSRAERMVARLCGQGLEIGFDDVKEVAGLGPIGRPHIAEALVNRGHVGSFNESFLYYIGRHCPAYVRKYDLSPADAVKIIHDAGGLAVLAHPLAGTQDRAAVLEVIDSGIDGLEVIHPKLDKSASAWLQGLAEKTGLLMTGGSDYHGEGRSYAKLGEIRVPLELAEKVARWPQAKPQTLR